MQNDGGGAAAAEANAAPTKRTRRPSVRLHEPYYENLPGHRKMQRQWNPIKRHSERAKKPRTLRTVHAKNKKNDGASDASQGEKMENLKFDGDDVAIGNWKNLNASFRDRDFKRKRVRPSSSKKRVSAKPRPNEDQENQNSSLSSGCESGKQGQREKEEEEEEEEEEEGDGEGNNSNLVVENTDLSSPNCSFGNDDGNDKLSDDNNNVNKNQGMKNSQDTNEMRWDMRIKEGDRKMNSVTVRAWLNELGLDKYAPLFEVHEVDNEVLAQLTLEDLKDMGINAVGTRRKMYSSIQKLGKGLS